MKIQRLLFVTLILAFCSMVYELILAQALSAFLENTILRYSVTIGLYMFSMGIGSLLAEGRVTQKPIRNMLKIEILLTLLGGFSVIILFSLNLLHPSRFLFSAFAHGLIVAIGILTGFEIPLLIVVANRQKDHSEDMILAWDYVGAFLATLVFAFYFYPYLGLVATSFLIGLLNAICGLVLSFVKGREDSKESRSMFSFYQGILFLSLAIIIVCIIYSNSLSDFFIAQYVQ